MLSIQDLTPICQKPMEALITATGLPSEVVQLIDAEARRHSMPDITTDTLIPILLFVSCRSSSKFRSATINLIAPFLDIERSFNPKAGRDLFCLANFEVAFQIMARFPNFFDNP